MTVDAEPVCEQCHDTGTVPVRQHRPACGIRCAPDCPQVIQRQCPACAKRELGDDLQWSAS